LKKNFFQRGELLAIFIALKVGKHTSKLNFISDSEYAIVWMGEWGNKRSNNWNVKNQDTITELCKELRERTNTGYLAPYVIWVGHQSNNNVFPHLSSLISYSSCQNCERQVLTCYFIHNLREECAKATANPLAKQTPPKQTPRPKKVAKQVAASVTSPAASTLKVLLELFCAELFIS
jgi:hypothetical protein